MKHTPSTRLLTLLALVASATASSQTIYYDTGQPPLLTQAQLDSKIEREQAELTEQLGSKFYLLTDTKMITERGDSAIHTITLSISGQKREVNPTAKWLNRKLPLELLVDQNGNPLDPSALTGKPTLINFWFVSCKACIEEMPALNRLYDASSDDYNFLAVTFEKPKKAARFLSKREFKFRHLVDASKFIDEIGIVGGPFNLFLDSQGVLRVIEGGIPYEMDGAGELVMGSEEAFAELLDSLQ